ncbi:hypothetical protein G8C92_20920 [Paenibacillus donghaensis]|uniref:hypothetical protein n=1 Tax=Paenibacillus donghaensis TaxID=414771 RepID=UPI001883D545|nr:hypothetical protein [Paenibacillus donghaensis]MBE9916485.1 hypothetical protein [Paenibacillus donghaensis]
MAMNKVNNAAKEETVECTSFYPLSSELLDSQYHSSSEEVQQSSLPLSHYFISNYYFYRND